MINDITTIYLWYTGEQLSDPYEIANMSEYTVA